MQRFVVTVSKPVNSKWSPNFIKIIKNSVCYSIRCGQMMKLYQSSTWRELKAVEITLKGCVDFFKNKFVKLFTDNQNVERISEVGSMKKDLQSPT
jgi:hypothetical protein